METMIKYTFNTMIKLISKLKESGFIRWANDLQDYVDKPIHYPRLLDLQFFKDCKIQNTDIPLYKNPEVAYEEYLCKYKKWDREQKINQLLNGTN